MINFRELLASAKVVLERIKKVVLKAIFIFCILYIIISAFLPVWFIIGSSIICSIHWEFYVQKKILKNTDIAKIVTIFLRTLYLAVTFYAVIPIILGFQLPFALIVTICCPLIVFTRKSEIISYGLAYLGYAAIASIVLPYMIPFLITIIPVAAPLNVALNYLLTLITHHNIIVRGVTYYLSSFVICWGPINIICACINKLFFGKTYINWNIKEGIEILSYFKGNFLLEETMKEVNASKQNLGINHMNDEQITLDYLKNNIRIDEKNQDSVKAIKYLRDYICSGTSGDLFDLQSDLLCAVFSESSFNSQIFRGKLDNISLQPKQIK